MTTPQPTPSTGNGYYGGIGSSDYNNNNINSNGYFNGGNGVNGNSNNNGNQLLSNGRNTLNQNESLQSIDGVFKLEMQSDGNLVLKRNGHPVDATHTWHKGSKGFYKLVLQNDGFLKIFDKNGKSTYTAGRTGSSPYRLVLQNDSRVVLFDSQGISTVIM